MQSFVDWPVYQSVGLTSVAWSILLLLVWASPYLDFETKKQGADRVLATIHGVLTAVLGISVELFSEPNCDAPLWWTRAPMLVLLGYLWTDLFSMLICDVWMGWRNIDIPMIFHHIFIITFFMLGYAINVGIWFGSTLLINELSTPFFTMFWYLIYTDQKDSQAFLLNGGMFVLVFFFCRMLFIPFSFYQLAQLNFCSSSSNPAWSWARPVMIGGYAALMLLNSLWFQKLCSGCMKAWNKRDGRAQLNRDLLAPAGQTPAVE